MDLFGLELYIDKKLTLCYNAKNSKKVYNGIVN